MKISWEEAWCSNLTNIAFLLVTGLEYGVAKYVAVSWGEVWRSAEEHAGSDAILRFIDKV